MAKNAKSPVTVRIRTRSRWRSLDPAQLTSPDARRRQANALVSAVGKARGGYLGPFTKKRRGRDAAIRESADDLLALAGRLRDDEPIDARGAALTARLLHDRSSPLRRDSGPELQHAARAALVALDGLGEPHELESAA